MTKLHETRDLPNLFISSPLWYRRTVVLFVYVKVYKQVAGFTWWALTLRVTSSPPPLRLHVPGPFLRTLGNLTARVPCLTLCLVFCSQDPLGNMDMDAPPPRGRLRSRDTVSEEDTLEGRVGSSTSRPRQRRTRRRRVIPPPLPPPKHRPALLWPPLTQVKGEGW